MKWVLAPIVRTSQCEVTLILLADGKDISSARLHLFCPPMVKTSPMRGYIFFALNAPHTFRLRLFCPCICPDRTLRILLGLTCYPSRGCLDGPLGLWSYHYFSSLFVTVSQASHIPKNKGYMLKGPPAHLACTILRKPVFFFRPCSCSPQILVSQRCQK